MKYNYKNKIINIIILIIPIFLLPSWGYKQGSQNTNKGNSNPESSQNKSSSSYAENTTKSIINDKILIATWNIQNFGYSKANDPIKMENIANILKNYDVIAVQEISNVNEQSDSGCPRNENACPGNSNCNLIRNALERYLNQANGMKYNFVFSPQVNDERYLYIYKPEKVKLINAELVKDPNDSLPVCDTGNTGIMVRQPFKAKFKAGNFDFILLTAHTRPSTNVQELDGLELFYKQVKNEGEPDIIVLGDLNADCGYLKNSDNIKFRNNNFRWVVPDDADTTVGNTNCAYDRIIFQSSTDEDYTGNWGINKNVSKDLSDHYLVWAEFWNGKDSN